MSPHIPGQQYDTWCIKKTPDSPRVLLTWDCKHGMFTHLQTLFLNSNTGAYLSPSSEELGYLANRVVANNTCMVNGQELWWVVLDSVIFKYQIGTIFEFDETRLSTRFGPRRDETVSRSGADKAREASSGWSKCWLKVNWKDLHINIIFCCEKNVWVNDLTHLESWPGSLPPFSCSSFSSRAFTGARSPGCTTGTWCREALIFWPMSAPN